MESAISAFFQCSRFAVCGASTNRSKFGNRVLRCYQANGRTAIPIHPTMAEIEGESCFKNLLELPDTSSVAVSIITPPQISIMYLEQAAKMNIKHIWLQPGADSPAVHEVARRLDLNIISGGPCVLIDLPHHPSQPESQNVDPAVAEENKADFLACSRIAVCLSGAPPLPTDFGSRVIRRCEDAARPVTPVHPQLPSVEGVDCASSLTAALETAADPAADPAAAAAAPVSASVAVSIATPPAVTLLLLQEAARLGLTRVWLEPGSESGEVVTAAEGLGVSLVRGAGSLLDHLILPTPADEQQGVCSGDVACGGGGVGAAPDAAAAGGGGGGSVLGVVQQQQQPPAAAERQGGVEEDEDDFPPCF